MKTMTALLLLLLVCPFSARAGPLDSGPLGGSAGGSVQAAADYIASLNLYGDITAVLGDTSGTVPILYQNPVAFSDADTTPDVSAGQVFITANTGATTITDFDDGTNHAGLQDGRELVVICNDTNTIFDFSASQLTGHGGVDWTCADGESVRFIYSTDVDGDGQWVGTVSAVHQLNNITISAGTASTIATWDAAGELVSNTALGDLNADGTLNVASSWATSGTISGAIAIVNTTAATLAMTAAQCRGTLHTTDDDAIDYTLPGAAAGLNCCWHILGGTGVITIDPVDGTDTIYLDGVSVGAGDAIDSPAAAGAFICLFATDATNWYTMGRSGTWVDGGVD